MSPLAILERGYALVFDASGKLLKDAAQVKAGDEIVGAAGSGGDERDGEEEFGRGLDCGCRPGRDRIWPRTYVRGQYLTSLRDCH